MAPNQPYQPSLLRLLHGAVAVLVPLAWLTGLAVLVGYDRHWFPAAAPLPGEWIEIHGTVGVVLWPLAILFGLYALSLGRARLRQPANAAALLSLALAVGSGKLMEEDWLRDGQFDHLVYKLHVLAWALLAGVVLWHVVAVVRRGGPALATSMASLQLRDNDRPQHWPGQLWRWLRPTPRP